MTCNYQKNQKEFSHVSDHDFSHNLQQLNQDPHTKEDEVRWQTMVTYSCNSDHFDFLRHSVGMKKFLDLTKGQLKAAGHCRMNDQWASSFFTTGIWVNVFPSFLRDFFQQIRYCPFVPRGQWHHFYSSFVPQTPSTKKPT